MSPEDIAHYADVVRRQREAGDLPAAASDPHLFIAKDAWDVTSLWFGTGPDDRHCELVDLGGHGGSHPIAVRKALWEALAASPFVQDAADWTPDA